MPMWNIKDAAKAWGVAERTVRQYCEDRRVPGAKRVQGTRTFQWMIPENSEKPIAKAREERKCK